MNDDDTPLDRRQILALASGFLAATSGCLEFLGFGDDESDESDESGESSEGTNTTSNGGDNSQGRQQESQNNSTSSENENGNENESVEDTAPEEQNESNTQVSDTADEESTQPTSTELDDAVRTANVTPWYSGSEFSVTGEVWNDIDETISTIIVEVTPLDKNENALSDPLVDGTSGLEPDDVFFFEVRSRNTAVVEKVEDYDLTVTARQDDY